MITETASDYRCFGGAVLVCLDLPRLSFILPGGANPISNYLKNNPLPRILPEGAVMVYLETHSWPGRSLNKFREFLQKNMSFIKLFGRLSFHSVKIGAEDAYYELSKRCIHCKNTESLTGNEAGAATRSIFTAEAILLNDFVWDKSGLSTTGEDFLAVSAFTPGDTC